MNDAASAPPEIDPLPSLKIKRLSFGTTPPKKKYKVLMLSDHPLCTSGVGVQARFLIEGLLRTGKYSFRCLGGAIKHPNYDTVTVNGNPDFVIKPVDGFGTHESIRRILMTERPDALVIFTDPRQFVWLWEIEDEIHQLCPIAYWHVWDNDPYPGFNRVWYDSTDLIVSLSHKTHEMVAPHYPDKAVYIPHAFPVEVYHQLPPPAIKALRNQHFGDKQDWFVGLWVNRNATRKMPNDVLNAWKLFLDNLYTLTGHRKALLVMHTDPLDIEGPNLVATVDMLGLRENVWFSNQKLEFEHMNHMHNMVDFTINISKAEGFGLSTMISLKVGRPIVANCTGGLTRQVIDYRDGFEYGVPVKPAARTMVGSQVVPYIYDDHVSYVDVANAFMKLYAMGSEQRAVIGQRAMEYAEMEFGFPKMIADWDVALEKCITAWHKNKTTQKHWQVVPLLSHATELVLPPRQDPALQAKNTNMPTLQQVSVQIKGNDKPAGETQ